MTAVLQGFDRQARRYFGAIAWLFGIVFRRYRTRALFVFASSTLGVIMVGAGMAGIFSVLSALESGGTIGFAGLEFVTDPDHPMLWVAGIAALLIVAGAAAVFAARSASVQIAGDLLAHLMAESLAVYGGAPPHPLDFRNDRQLRAAIGRLRSSYARRCFLVVRQTLDAPVLVLTFLAGILALVWLQPTASLVVLLVIVLVLPAYYLVNTAAVKATKRYETLARPARRESQLLMDVYARRPHDHAATVHAAFDAAPAIRERVRTFARRFLATVRADLTSQLSGAIALLALLAFLGVQVLAGSLSITAVVAFMLVLRFVLTAMRGVFRSFALISRHYPAIYRFARFTARRGRTRTLPAGSEFPLRLIRGGLREPGTPKRTWRISAGTVLGVNAPVTPSRYSVWYFASLLAGGNDEERVRAIRDATRVATLPPAPTEAVSLREHYGLPDGSGFDEVTLAVGADAAATLRREGFDDLDRPREPESFAALRGAPSAALTLASALLHESSVVLAPTRLLDGDVKEIAGDRLIVARYRGRPLRQITDLHVVAASDGAIVAWGSPAWVRENWTVIKEVQAEYEEALLRTLGEDADVSEDDEDDA